MNDIGLGLFLDKDNPGQFGHDGADRGFQARLTMNADTGNGVAIMVNSDNGTSLANHIVRRVAKEYAWKYQPPPESAWDRLFLLAKLQGIQAAFERYDELKLQAGAVNEQTLNTMGYLLLNGGREMDGLRAFQKNVQEYPQSANAYDSLGEAYMKMGQKDLSIQKYEKSLQLNPKNDNAVGRLKKLRGEAL